MKNLIFIGIVCLLPISCLTSKKDLIKNNYISVDYVTHKEGNSITCSSKQFEIEQLECKKQDTYGEIMSNTQIEFSSESKAQIERDGGLLKVLENNLSKENYDKLINRTSFEIGAVLNQDAIPSGYSFRMYNENMKDIVLSDVEINNIFNYISSLKFVFIKKASGSFKVAAYYGYSLRK